MIIKNSTLLTFFVLLTGCSHYEENMRQQHLEESLNTHYAFEQRPATAIAPAQYFICGGDNYSCRRLTPLHLRTAKHPELHAGLSLKRKIKTEKPRKD